MDARRSEKRMASELKKRFFLRRKKDLGKKMLVE